MTVPGNKNMSGRRLLMLCNGSDLQTTGKLFASLSKRLEPCFEDIDVRFRAFPIGVAAKICSLAFGAVQDARAAARSDLLIVHSALSLALPAIVSATIFRRPVIAFIWDIYPEGTSRPETLLQKLAWVTFRCTERLAYSLATRVAVPSADYLPHLPKSIRRKTDIWPLWMTEPIRERGCPPPRQVIKIAFAGQINQIRGLGEAIRFLARALPLPIELHLFSQDPIPRDLKEGLDGVAIVPRGFLPTDAFQSALKKLDFGLIALDTKFGSPAFPSKVMSYTAIGLPILYSGPSALADLKHVVQSCGLGFVIDDATSYSKPDIAQLFASYPLARRSYLQAIEEKQVELAASI